MKPVIKVENLSKQYRLGDIGTGSMRDDFKRWRYNLMGKEDPFLTVGEVNDRTTTGKSDYVWALKDINFDVQQGDVLGIIGRNGAGKSTLLKILSRTTGPTTGTIKMKGRIASLLEVGTGFHGELSGRENIYLNGAIMGLRKHEIKQKLDEIIDFAGVERYIDTPVKRYSSGMYVRLAFGVAAHLEPDILIVDEVLAVGDIEFQNKCLGKMGDITAIDGRTVIFVSHNMASVQKLCRQGIFLHEGKIEFSGPVDQAITRYLESGKVRNTSFIIPQPLNFSEIEGYAYNISVEDLLGNEVAKISVGKAWQIRIKFRINKKVTHFIIAIGIINAYGVDLRTCWSKETDIDKGDYEAIFQENDIILAAGTYSIVLGLSSYERSIQFLPEVAFINISDLRHISLDSSIIRTQGVGLILNAMDVKINQI